MPKRRRSTTYGNKPNKQLQEQQANQVSVKSLSKAKCKQSQINNKHSSITENKIKNVKHTSIKMRSNENQVKLQIFKNKIKTKLEKLEESSVAKEWLRGDQKPCTSNKCKHNNNNTRNFSAENSAKNYFIIKQKKSKSEVLDTVTRRINNRTTEIVHKSSTIWTKFPINYVKSCVKSKAPATNLTSVYQPGTSYSDVLFSAGPSCSVNIKTMASDAIIEAQLPPLHYVDDLDIKVPRNEDDAIICKTAYKSYSQEVLVPKRSHEEVLATAITKEFKNMRNIDYKFSSNKNDKNAIIEDTVEKDKIQKTNSMLSKSVESISESLKSQKSANNAELTSCKLCNEIEYLKNNLKRLTSESHDHKTNNILKLDISLWNFTELDEGPEIYPRYSKQFNDEMYLLAEDMANLGFKLSRGN